MEHILELILVWSGPFLPVPQPVLALVFFQRNPFGIWSSSGPTPLGSGSVHKPQVWVLQMKESSLGSGPSLLLVAALSEVQVLLLAVNWAS